MNNKERLNLIRSSMKEKAIDTLLIPDTDPHISTSLAAPWRIVEWVSGFTGSSGTLIITMDLAGLWTDSRYFVQAESQLEGSGFILMNADNNDRDGFINWVAENTERGGKIGVDGRVFSIRNYNRLNNLVKGKDIEIAIDCDLVSDHWTDRPEMTANQAFELPVKFSGKDRSSRIRDVRTEMEKAGADYHLLTAPDDIMWLLNIRAGDTDYSPLLLSFAIVGKEQILLFADESKIPPAMAADFDRLGIVILPYDETDSVLSHLDAGTSVLLTPASTSAILYNSVPEGVKIIEEVSIPSRFKSIRNNVEIEGLNRIMVRDGVALSKLFFLVEKEFGSSVLTEMSVSKMLNELRSEQDNFLSLSFASIVASNPHAALPHYSPSIDTDIEIKNGILLIDSGSHYLDGTTDITRTIALGEPTRQMKTDFTLVLKGMIRLARAKFPAGTFGYQLDALARKDLWEAGMNYGHGTGHGVGFCLNVHEGNFSISPLAVTSHCPIMPGMVISDEPGVYRPDKYGIRIENLLACYKDEETEFGTFLRFSTLSLCYIDSSLIDVSMLDKSEIDWINSYHEEVYSRLSSFLTNDEKEWLRKKTTPLSHDHHQKAS
ncbi:MAG TPA: aminopeptidase P family protein [Bacteroidales bacterium]|nr:aminopeptidase P family protein [Bacteroidales bacterium]